MTSEIDTAQFRAVLGHVPTSVVVVTGVDKSGKPFGITIGSFVSVSLEPPLVGFLPATKSRSWASIAESGNFCVNVLGAQHEEFCWRFAKEGDDKFEGVDWRPSELGSPVLPGVIATIDCSMESQTEVGDHFFVVGRVHSLQHEDNVANAMVFFRGKVVSADHAG